MTPPLPHLLDLDGTLADTLPDIQESTNHLRRLHGLPDASTAQIRSFIGDGALKLLERALPGIDPVGPIWEQYKVHHLDQCTRLVRPFDGVMEMLAQWRSEERPLAVVTNKPRVFTERILDHLEMNHYFPVVICGDSLPEKKPSPLPLREALAQLGVSVDRGMMIGDGLQDIRAARAAGLKCTACLFGMTPPSDLRAEKADIYWASFGTEA